jgi:membrane protein implicated in regulation of membrane protease activity
MSFATLAASPMVWWLAAAILFGVGEFVIPGVFLIFLAIAAGITGLAAFALPDLPLAAQLVSFAVWSGVTVAIGKRWYRDYPVASSDPKLNDRAARLIGETVTVCDAIVDGAGRVRIGDGTWSAHGPDAPTGAAVRIVAVAGSTLLVEPAGHLPPAES